MVTESEKEKIFSLLIHFLLWSIIPLPMSFLSPKLWHVCVSWCMYIETFLVSPSYLSFGKAA